MSKYNIKRWDAVLAPNQLNKIPMIYIEPDIEFLNFAKNNNYYLVVKIENTNSIYDGKEIIGTVSKSNFMSNFYSDTNLYVITLKCIWFGYPENLGTATFYGFKE